MNTFSTFLGNDIKCFHFIGIGGIGMSALAILLNQLGYSVQGSDKNYNAVMQRLEKLGIKVFEGHKEKNITNVDCIVLSSSIKQSNVEFTAAKKRNILVLHRFDLIKMLCRQKFSILITGSNGKTTTTSMVSEVLSYYKIPHTSIVGGIMPKIGSNLLYQQDSKYCVAEICESDGNFIHLTPDLAIVSNIDEDHLDFYNDIENIKQHFAHFVSRIPSHGGLIFCWDNEMLKKVIDKVGLTNKMNYSIKNPSTNVFAKNIKYSFDTTFDLTINYQNTKHTINDITIPVTGECNLYNALGALSTAVFLGCNIKNLKNCLKGFFF